METIKVSDEALRKGAEEGMDGFLQVFIDKYLEVTGGVINAETMPLLNGHQHTLLGYHILREEFPELVSKLPSLWTRSYLSSTDEVLDESVITEYLLSQKNKLESLQKQFRQHMHLMDMRLMGISYMIQRRLLMCCFIFDSYMMTKWWSVTNTTQYEKVKFIILEEWR